MRRLVLAMVVGGAVVAAGAVVTVTLAHDTASPSRQAAPRMVTLTLGASGEGGATTVEYSCPAAPVAGCRAEIGAGDLTWTRRVTVPVGTAVHVRVSSPAGRIAPTCWVGDELDSQPPLASSEPQADTATCRYTASA